MFTQNSYRFWLPIRGESIEGIYIRNEEIIADGSTRNLYLLENDTGTHAIIGSPSLDEGMNYAHLGDRLRIVFRGQMLDKNGNRCASYQVLKNRWLVLSVAEAEVDEDGITLL